LWHEISPFEQAGKLKFEPETSYAGSQFFASRQGRIHRLPNPLAKLLMGLVMYGNKQR
jgi:hypothetical protein